MSIECFSVLDDGCVCFPCLTKEFIVEESIIVSSFMFTSYWFCWFYLLQIERKFFFRCETFFNSLFLCGNSSKEKSHYDAFNCETVILTGKGKKSCVTKHNMASSIMWKEEDIVNLYSFQMSRFISFQCKVVWKFHEHNFSSFNWVWTWTWDILEWQT